MPRNSKRSKTLATYLIFQITVLQFPTTLTIFDHFCQFLNIFQFFTHFPRQNLAAKFKHQNKILILFSCLPSPIESPYPGSQDCTSDFDLQEFLQIKCERDLSNLTLSDQEQREVYEAAQIIQKAYRSYKGRKKEAGQDREAKAAIVIQNYYRRYKQVWIKNLLITVIFRNFRRYKQRVEKPHT